MRKKEKRKKIKRLNTLEFKLNTELEYGLFYFNTEDEDLQGEGYIVIRLSDYQKLFWRTLTRDTGLESIKVSGCLHYIENLQQECFRPGSLIELVHEPDNPYSKTAIAVYDSNKKYKIGYIPKEEEKRILKRIENNEIGKSIIMWENKRGDERVSVRLLLIDSDKEIIPMVYLISDRGQ